MALHTPTATLVNIKNLFLNYTLKKTLQRDSNSQP